MARLSTARHWPEVVRRTREGEREYVVSCLCDVEFEGQASRRMAEMDLRDHLAAVTEVDTTELCQRPREHRTPPTERCSLCADQMSLWDDLADELREAG